MDKLPQIKELDQMGELLRGWQDSLLHYLPNIVLALVLMLIFLLLGKFFRKLAYKSGKRIFRNQEHVSGIISSVVYIFFIVSGIFLALEELNLEGFLSRMLAGAGIVGIIAGFAFKDIASNAFAGILIKSQAPFKPGDWVDLSCSFGRVQEVGFITTVVRNIEGQLVHVPNQLIYNNVFYNYSALGRRRVIVQTGVSYGDDLEKVKRVALEEVMNVSGLLRTEPVDFYYTEIGASSYNFEIRFWINFIANIDYLRAKSECIMKLKKRFEEENISIAYNVTTLDFGGKGGVNLWDDVVHVQTKEGL